MAGHRAVEVACLCQIRPLDFLRDPRPAAPARWSFPGLPGLLRASRGELLDHDRSAHERRVRLHRHAHQRPAGRAADPRGGGLRPQRADLPARAVRRVPGEPPGEAARTPTPERPLPSAPEQYVEYKANRRETPADFRGQLSLIFEVLDALGIARLSLAGHEAADIIAPHGPPAH